MTNNMAPPTLGQETLYVGVDIGKSTHVAGFISATLLARHQRFEHCPALTFANSREGFRSVVDRIQSYVPLTQVYVVLEITGHYHRALQQYLQELDVPVYAIHVQKRQGGLLKTDKRDALGLANHLYNHLEKGIQVADPLQAVRQLAPPTPAAAELRGMVRHRSELIGESTQRKNKLTAISDELFPELTQVLRNPNSPTALALRARFPTPQALAAASLADLHATKGYTRLLTDAKLLDLQRLARQSIGTKDRARVQGLVFEQEQLMKELALIEQHLEQLEARMTRVVEGSREGQILTSIQPIGPIQAATIIAMIGNIANFDRPAQLKSYFGWAPAMAQSGSSLDHVHLSPRGTRLMKQTLYLIVWQAIRHKECEWARIYERLVPIKCSYDERTRRFTGRGKVIGRIAGQIVSVIYALLKKDQETLSKLPPGRKPPEPVLYDAEVHRRHREGHYRAPAAKEEGRELVRLPSH